MKHINESIRQKTAATAFGGLVLALSLALTEGTFAQSADIFSPTPKGSVSEGGKATEKEPEPDPVDDKPSRFAGQEIAAYTASRAAVFSMRSRVTDPFGLNQDPTVKPVVRKVVSNLPIKRQTALPPTPLSDIVKKIRVTTIIPGERKFLVGVRSFSEFEEFPLRFNGKVMRMKVMEVTARSILFQNLDNGETASLETEMLPAGMIAGGDKIQPPGLVSPLDDIPLELNSGRDLDSNN